MPENLIDMTPKGQLQGGLLAQAGSEAEAETFRAFVAQITDEQAAQLLTLDGFTERYQIPIWDNETGGPPRDPARKHDTPPDRYMEGTTEPRRVIDDLAALLPGVGSLEEVQSRVEALSRMNTINPKYWGRLSAILGASPKDLLSVAGRKVQNIDFPIDKVNTRVWKLLENAISGQLEIAVEKQSSKKQISIIFSINFDELGKDIAVSRKLEPFDRRVYVAIDALYKAGNMLISFSQIHFAMGYTTRPAKTDIDRIRKSIYKMRHATVYLNNSQEIAAHYRYDKVQIEGPLLPSFIKSGIINGKQVDEALCLLCEPPLVAFARGRKQITTIKRELFETPVSKTDQNLLIEDYLLERIAHAKNGRQPKKILYSTLYEEANLTTQKQQQRVKSKLTAILGHYVKCGYIKEYTDEGDAITFSV